MAAICSRYYVELRKYKDKLVNVIGISDDEFEICHPSQSNNIPDEHRTPEYLKQRATDFLSNYDGDDKEMLISFLWDYDSWGGGKNIKRDNDFTVSPCLNIANSINASSALIGDLAKAIGESEDLFLQLNEYGLERTSVPASKGATHPLPLQRIFYGAPGTGKSHEVKELTAGRKVKRTTFHPDSDYSTFVGAYKPTMTDGKWEERILTVEELIAKLKEIKNDGEPRYAHRFGAEYSKTLKSLGSDVRKGIVLSSGCTEATDQEVTKGMEVGEYLKKIFSKDSKIVYTFVAQAFLQAYVEAWRRRASEAEDKDVFLVIEEINRGNCAQIFGDLFQLLDRGDDGFSEYPIEADADMRKYLSKALNGLSADSLEESLSEDRAAKVLSGEELLLPDNLHIWATMNTSDQSLFPIDSAFKRRWDWAYVPIEEGKKEGKPLSWQIAVGDKRYDWWAFLQAINNKIGEATKSEDKKLGYFFCKAKEGTISAETFVAKVVFYLWNDVYKDYETEATIFTDEEGKPMPFHHFYSAFGKVNEEAITTLLNKLEVEAVATPQDEPQTEE